jgi:hypothetical protein
MSSVLSKNKKKEWKKVRKKENENETKIREK